MNVNDYSSDVIPSDFTTHDMLDHIFIMQMKHTMEYIPIEKSNGLCYDDNVPVDLHTGKGQARIKDFFLRVIEELGEADEAREVHPDDPTHCIEELADALHFLVEAYILCGIDQREIARSVGGTMDSDDKLIHVFYSRDLDPYDFKSDCWAVCRALTDAGNMLKQRPWKQSHQITDVKRFKKTLLTAFPRLMKLFQGNGLKPEDIFAIYFKKSAVNQFRRRTVY